MKKNATAALEVMSRFAANRKWLIYLPPTMSPSEDDGLEPGLLEHPAKPLPIFATKAVPQVVCEEKHMGSRAVVVVCRDQKDAARDRFGITEETGIVYTRTGRRFFNDLEVERQVLQRLVTAPSPPLVFGTSSTQRGPALTANSCRGQPRLRSYSVRSMPQSVLLGMPLFPMSWRF